MTICRASVYNSFLWICYWAKQGTVYIECFNQKKKHERDRRACESKWHKASENRHLDASYVYKKCTYMVFIYSTYGDAAEKDICKGNAYVHKQWSMSNGPNGGALSKKWQNNRPHPAKPFFKIIPHKLLGVINVWCCMEVVSTTLVSSSLQSFTPT